MSEIFIRNVNFLATSHDVTRELAKHLHVRPYTSGAPINFRVWLFKGNRGRGRQHKGCGTVTLPTAEIGAAFLRDYGGTSPTKSISILGRRLSFSQSTRPPSHDIIIHINNSPYVDPQLLEERERITDDLEKNTVSIRGLQFGWDCRDRVYDVEWDYACPEGSKLKFDHENRRFSLDIAPAKSPRTDASAAGSGSESMFASVLEDFFRDPGELFKPKLSVAIRYAQVDYLSASGVLSEEPSIYISLTTPPSFEERPSDVLSLGGSVVQGKKLPALPLSDKRNRLHADVASYTSLSLRVVCDTPRDIQEFRRMADKTQLGIAISNDPCLFEQRNLFSNTALEQFRAWIRALDFHIAFQVEALVMNYSADPTELLLLRPFIDELASNARVEGPRSMERATRMLREFGSQARELFWSFEGKNETLQECFQRVLRRQERVPPPPSPRRLDDGIFMCLHISITPTSMEFAGPIPERSNRVIRSYEPQNHGNFIRVSFVDEGKLQVRFDRDIDATAFVHKRLGPFLLNGLVIAGRTFEFLGYSQSALKEHSLYFVTPFVDRGRRVTAASIIKSLGSFDNLPSDSRLMFCPARYGARISQAFTATDPTTVLVENIRVIEDIVTRDPGGKVWTHTDGVGTMSPQFARSIHAERQSRKRGRQHSLEDYPRALQIRFMGSKGMLSVDHTLTGSTVCLRPSMIKFTGTQSNKIEIAKVFDKPGTFYLNRPLIMLLEGLGVPYKTFETYQNLAVADARESTENLEKASRFLQGHGLGSSFRIPSLLLSLYKLGPELHRVDDNPFYDLIMRYGINHVLRLLKHRARIPVPGAYNLVGIADVHQFLRPGEVFICIRPETGSGLVCLEGPVMVSRSPTIHPGDVQIVKAIGPPPPGSCFEIEPLVNTLVFSTTDPRPISSCLGGGDLDGDEYNVIPLKDLPEFTPKVHAPSQYPAATRQELDRPCTMRDVAEFGMNYITSDVLGHISISWRLLADQTHIFNPDCMKLADLHSLAVDYPKSGKPVPLADIPKRSGQLLPDWYAPETMLELDTSKYYYSQKAIGLLFRQIELDSSEMAGYDKRSSRQHHARPSRNERGHPTEAVAQSFESLHIGSDSVSRAVVRRVREFINPEDDNVEVSDTLELFERYCSNLRSICMMHTLSHSRGSMLSEEEAVVGTIIANSAQPRKRLDHIGKLRDDTDMLVKEVRDSLEGDGTLDSIGRLHRSFHAWLGAVHLSQGSTRPIFGAKSFAWVALGAVFESIRDIEAERERVQFRLLHPNLRR